MTSGIAKAVAVFDYCDELAEANQRIAELEAAIDALSSVRDNGAATVTRLHEGKAS